MAIETKDDLLERITGLQLVQEARALDSEKRLYDKFMGGADHESAKIVKLICEEEIPHVEIGVKWFKYICNKNDFVPITKFQSIIEKYKWFIPRPFNKLSRERAGFNEEWYLPIANKFRN